jgi:hypothetical protein
MMLRTLACGLAVTLTGCTDSAAPPSGRFAFREPLTSDVVRLEVTNPTGLNQAQDLLGSGTTRWAMGTPRRGDGGFNAPWTWHLDPATISFAEFTIEACQTRAAAVAEDLDYWIAFGQVCIAGVVETRER